MSLLKEVPENVLATDTLVLANSTSAGAATTTISQELTTNTVITVPPYVSKVNVKFTNALSTGTKVTISVDNIGSVAVGTELVLYIELTNLSPDVGSEIYLLSSDFYYTRCSTPTNFLDFFNVQYLVLSFLFNGTLFVNTNDLC